MSANTFKDFLASVIAGQLAPSAEVPAAGQLAGERTGFARVGAERLRHALPDLIRWFMVPGAKRD